MSVVGTGAVLHLNLGTHADPVWFDPRPRRSASSPDAACLLGAIRAHPPDDAPRLAYADWLGEHGEDDLDRATAEFVRASCRGVPSRSVQQPRSAYPWIDGHWRRLVPRFAAELAARPGHEICRTGSAVRASATPLGSPLPVLVTMKFRRGFLELCSVKVSPADVAVPGAVFGTAFWRLLTADQPLVRCECDGHTSVVRTDNGLRAGLIPMELGT